MSNPDPVKTRELVKRISNCRYACGCPTCQKNHHLMREAADMIEELSKFLPPEPGPPAPEEIIACEINWALKAGAYKVGSTLKSLHEAGYSIVHRDEAQSCCCEPGSPCKLHGEAQWKHTCPEIPDDRDTIELMESAYASSRDSKGYGPNVDCGMRRAVAVLKQRWEAQQK